jgi:uncharacterized protein (TIGR03086 family)
MLYGMDANELHARAQQVYAAVLAHVTDDDLGKPTPCTEWDVASLIDHINAGNARVVAAGGGEPPELPGDRITAHATSWAGAQAVFDAPDGLTQPFQLPFGEVPGSVFATIRAGDLYSHAWDLATAIGADTDLDHEVGEAVLARTAPFLSPALRGEGRPFGTEQPCAADRPVADRVAAFVGRQVS